MRTLIISKKQANKRLDRIIRDNFTGLSPNALYKAFRKRDIKANGLRVKEDYIASEGDRIDIYIIDDILFPISQGQTAALNKGFSIVFEDKNILVVNKEQGVAVHPDRAQAENTLIDLVRDYLIQKGEFNPSDPSCFSPALCHRLDRNTGGLVILAKNSSSLSILLEKIKSKEIKKFYQCIVTGNMPKQSDELKAYLVKDDKKSRVFIYDKPSKDSVDIVTRYNVLEYKNDVSRLEVELITGRTHQIRAHLAHIGHPIVGDGKYGTNAINRHYKSKYQNLWAYKIIFDFKNGQALNYLRGKTFEVEPEFSIDKFQ